MEIRSTLPPTTLAAAPARPRTPEEAARQFEEVLVRQFVQTLTEGLFQNGLSGDDGPSWIEGQADLQRSTLADVLTRHLVDRGRFGIADQLLRQWDRTAASEADAPEDAAGSTPPPPA
ncbi:MAG: hypothetical protein D6685_05635, partial [Bacteroidetes bacterium]